MEVDMMERIVVELLRERDRSMYYRATGTPGGAVGESDRVTGFRDAHAQASLATQAVARLGERLESTQAAART
jgi:hypothetical protein